MSEKYIYKVGHYFSEDWLFCYRWTNTGGDVFIDVSINLSHSGILYKKYMYYIYTIQFFDEKI